MKTTQNLLITGLLASTLAACGGSTSSDTAATAATTVTSSLILNLDNVAAIATAEATGLRLAGSSGTVGLTAEGEIIENIISFDDPAFGIMNDMVIVSGDTVLVKVGFFSSPGEQQKDAVLPNGKSIIADCSGNLRIKNGEISCFVKNKADIKGELLNSDAPYTIKDNLGSAFVTTYDREGVYVLRIDSEGNVKILVTNKEEQPVILGVTDDGTAVIETNGLTRLYFLAGGAKTINSTGGVRVVGNYILGEGKLFTSSGEVVALTGATDYLHSYELTWSQQGGKIYGLVGNELVTVNLETKEITTAALNFTSSQNLYAATFVQNGLYYATVETGVNKVDLGTTSALRLAAESLVETKVEGLDGVVLFEMAAVGANVLFSAQSDATLEFSTGSISGATATQQDSEMKISGIQAVK